MGNKRRLRHSVAERARSGWVKRAAQRLGAMTAKKRKSLDAALGALFRERSQGEACLKLAELMRALPAAPQKAA